MRTTQSATHLQEDTVTAPDEAEPPPLIGQSDAQRSKQGLQILRRDDAGKISIKYPARDIDDVPSLLFLCLV